MRTLLMAASFLISFSLMALMLPTHPNSFVEGTAIDTVSANGYFEKAKAFRKERLNDSAIINFKKASAIFKEHQLWKQYFSAEIFHGELLARKQLYDSAVVHFKLLVIEFDSTDYFEYFQRYRINQNLGIINGRRKDVLASIAAFKNNVTLTREYDPRDSTKTLVNLARTFNNLAVEYMDINSLELAAQYYDSALLDLRTNLNEPTELEHVIYLNQGNVYKRLGYFDDALSAFEKSKSFFSLLRPGEIDDLEKGLFFWFRGSSYIYKNDLGNDAALALADNDSATYYMTKFRPDHAYLSYCDNSYAEIYLYLKQYDQAMQRVASARQRNIRIYGQRYPGLGYLDDLKARIFLALGEYDKAEAAALASIALYDSIDYQSYEEIAESYYTLSNIYKITQQYDLALSTVREGIKQVLPGFNPTNDLENPKVSNLLNRPSIYLLLEIKGDILSEKFRQSGQLNEILTAVSCYDLATNHIKLQRNEIISLKSKSSITARKVGIYEKAIDVTLKAHKATKNDSLLHLAFGIADRRKSANLKDRLAQERNKIKNNVPLDWRRQEQELKSRIDFLEKTIFDLSHDSLVSTLTIDSTKLVLFELKEKHRIHIDKLKSEFPYLYNSFQDRQFDAYQYLQNKKAKEALLTYFVGEDHIYYFLLDQKLEVFETPITSEFQKQINGLLHGIKSSNFDGELAFQVAEKVINPALAQLSTSSVQELVIVPDGILNYLPFEILVKDKPSKEGAVSGLGYLIKDYTISYYYATNLLQFLGQEQDRTYSENYYGFAPSFTKKSNALLATRSAEDSRIASSLENLPRTKEEVEFSAKIWGGKSFLEQEATESNFKQAGQNAQIIHLASHAIINDENPMYSKLVFTPQADSVEDGLLYTYELYNMNLNAQLACLSACNTGFGKLEQGEGVMSLARGFMYAGVPNVMMSLWSVPDNSSSEIMKSFYQNLKKGKGKAEALRLAKLTYLETADANTSDPYYWAAFTLVGNNKPLVQDRNGYWIYVILGLIVILVGGYVFKRNSIKAQS